VGCTTVGGRALEQPWVQRVCVSVLWQWCGVGNWSGGGNLSGEWSLKFNGQFFLFGLREREIFF
jgi:hypothetical protein